MTGGSLDTLLITMCHSILHIAKDERIAVANYIKEIAQKMLKASRDIQIPAQIFPKVFMSGHIRVDTNLTLKDYDEEIKNIWKEIEVWNKLQGVYVDCNFGPTKAE